MNLNVPYKVALMAITICLPRLALSDDGGNSDSTAARSVVAQMLQSIPSTIKRVCVLKIDLLHQGAAARQIMGLENLDKRIVTETSICLDGKNDPKSDVLIFYFGNINADLLKKMEAENHSTTASFKDAWDHLKNGDVLIGSSMDICGTDVRAFLFGNSKKTSRIIGSINIGTMECGSEMKLSGLSNDLRGIAP